MFRIRSILAGAGVAAASASGYYVYSSKRRTPQKVIAVPEINSAPPTRTEVVSSLRTKTYDMLVIGGGATGAGVALDAAARGLSVALVERDDFGSGTSSKSTKLIHGGVRYLQAAIMSASPAQFALVWEALRERGTFMHIAPHLSSEVAMILPIKSLFGIPYYWAGVKAYDALAYLAGGASADAVQGSWFLSKKRTEREFPTLQSKGLWGSILYHDGQHNDTRMNIALILSAIGFGADVVNYCEVTKLEKNDQGQVVGASVRDKESPSREEFGIKAKVVVNATGPFADSILHLNSNNHEPIVMPSSGAHIVLPSYVCPSDLGMIDPKTSDGRVIFVLPWLGSTLVGTTDTKCNIENEPQAKEQEINWILEELNKYMLPEVNIRRSDVLSAWSGIRPLVRDPDARDTKSVVRNHLINLASSGVLTIAGGKWTTYRAMAEETVDYAIKKFGLKAAIPHSDTEHIKLVGAQSWVPTLYIDLIQKCGLDEDVARHLSATYGDKSFEVANSKHRHRIAEKYPFIDSEISYACQNELAVRATDILARRTRLAFLNCQAALQALPHVIDVMAKELKWSEPRKSAEFEEGKEFLMSMGLPAVLRSCTREDLNKGAVVSVSSPTVSQAISGSKREDALRVPVGRSGGGC